MNLAKYKEQLYKTFLRKKKVVYYSLLFFSSFGMCTTARGRGNRIKQLLTSTSNFMLITPFPLPAIAAGEIDLGYIGVPRSPSAAAST